MILRRSTDRGHAHHGWLDARHSFSFADYYDPRWMGFRSLRVLNDDRIAPGMGFGMHPHRDMEILTYILAGSLEHQDSMGNQRVIRTGELQYMAAGSGVRHSEFNPSTTDPVHLLQIWIQPHQTGLTPRYADRSFSNASSGQWILAASPDGREESIAIHQDACLWISRLEANQTVHHDLPAGRHAWLHVAEGSVTLNGQTLSEGDAAALSGPFTGNITGIHPGQVLLFDLA